MLRPDGLAPRILNLAAWRTHLLSQLRRQISLTADPVLEKLHREAMSFPGPGANDSSDVSTDSLMIPLEIVTALGRLSFLNATTVFGTPLDVTLEEIALELLYPADTSTEKALRSATRSKSPMRDDTKDKRGHTKPIAGV